MTNMKQYRITTENLPTPTADDCYLSEDDPVHEIINQSIMGGLGAAARAYNMSKQYNVESCDKGRIQRENNIKPGTPEWFSLWYSNNTE